jgi:hypothetical protein
MQRRTRPAKLHIEKIEPVDLFENGFPSRRCSWAQDLLGRKTLRLCEMSLNSFGVLHLSLLQSAKMLASQQAARYWLHATGPVLVTRTRRRAGAVCRAQTGQFIPSEPPSRPLCVGFEPSTCNTNVSVWQVGTALRMLLLLLLLLLLLPGINPPT